MIKKFTSIFIAFLCLISSIYFAKWESFKLPRVLSGAVVGLHDMGKYLIWTSFYTGVFLSYDMGKTWTETADKLTSFKFNKEQTLAFYKKV